MQDGLPVSGKERELVAELAKTGSRNYASILRLINGGARIGHRISGTSLGRRRGRKARPGIGEASGHEALQQVPERFSPDPAGPIHSQSNQRDPITGEVGILFLGMLHSLEPFLEKDINVIYPIDCRPASVTS